MSVICRGYHARCQRSLEWIRSSWLSLWGAYSQTSIKCLLQSYHSGLFCKAENFPHALWVPRKAHQNSSAHCVLLKEAILRSWWDLIFIKKKSPPYPPPALHPPAHQQTNNPNQKTAKGCISWSNVLRLLFHGPLPKMCAPRQNCNPNYMFSTALCLL